MMDVNWSHFDDHFIRYANIKLLYCSPETNIMLNVTHIWIKKKPHQIETKIGK